MQTEPSQGWDSLLPYQSLEFPDHERLAPMPRPQPEPSPYVQHLSAGGWPDVTDEGYVRDARAERQITRQVDNRVALTTSPLSDRDGYTGSIPAGATLRLPAFALPDVTGGAKPAPMRARTEPPGRLRGWGKRAWAAAGGGSS